MEFINWIEIKKNPKRGKINYIDFGPFNGIPATGTFNFVGLTEPIFRLTEWRGSRRPTPIHDCGRRLEYGGGWFFLDFFFYSIRRRKWKEKKQRANLSWTKRKWENFCLFIFFILVNIFGKDTCETSGLHLTWNIVLVFINIEKKNYSFRYFYLSLLHL